MSMPGSFGTELNQLGTTATKTSNTVDTIFSLTKIIEDAINDLGRWNGQAKEEFVKVMGINLPELMNLNRQLEQMGGNITAVAQGVIAREGDTAKSITDILNMHQ